MTGPVLLALAVAGAAYGLTGARASGARRAETVVLRHPWHLAVSSRGTLYVVDPTRDQVLRRLSDGRFAVVAGSGRRGFAGDGGSARSAALRLSQYSAIAVARNGALYIADSGNHRVREVRPDGTIVTVAGGGRADIGSVSGLAIGSGGRLYLAAKDVFALSSRGTLVWVAGEGQGVAPINQASEGDFSNVQGDIAVDRAGDLYAATFPNLYERTAAGALRSLGTFRAGGGPGALAAGPRGAVFAAVGWGIYRLGTSTVSRASQTRRIDAALGWRLLERGPPVLPPTNGLAIAPNGTIYFDTNSGEGWTTDSVLVEVTPGGEVRALWSGS